MNPIDSLNEETDTTLSLIKSGFKLGVSIWVAEPETMSFEENYVKYKACKIIDESLKTGEEKEIRADSFDFLFIRQDPPFDLKYISNCYLLEAHRNFHKKPYFVNDPAGIKNFTEKIAPLYFYQLMPDTVITYSEDILKFMLEKHKNVVIKPLYLKGGDGIFKISNFDDRNLKKFNDLIKKYNSPVVIQAFVENVKFGDKRVILLDGKPIGVVNRIPKSGEFKANLHLGGDAKKTKLTTRERYICDKLKPFLIYNNLFLVGIDLIDEKLTEINVTSPTGLMQINELYGKDLSIIIWNNLIKKYRNR
ncbi:MAG: glutathione synthase [Alphaproteobacteria bacterium]